MALQKPIWPARRALKSLGVYSYIQILKDLPQETNRSIITIVRLLHRMSQKKAKGQLALPRQARKVCPHGRERRQIYAAPTWLLDFPGGSAVKHLPAIQERQEMYVQFLGREDPLEKEMATDSSILAWEIPWTEEPGGLQFIVLQRV